MNKYIELKPDKSPLTNFDTFYTDYSNLENAGLILPKDIVVVDFDERPDIAEEILSYYPTKVVKTTRGYHLYFKIPTNLNISNSTKITTVFGNKVDYKTGFNNKNAYAIVKLNGVKREVLNEDINIPILPKLLYPTKTQEDVLGLEEGNRNDVLYKHSLNIAHLFSKDSLIKHFFNISAHMDNPLEDKEIENIVKSAIKHKVEIVFDTDQKGKKNINIFKLVDVIENELNVTLCNDILYFRNENGRYSSNQIALLREIKNKGYLLKKNQDKELIHQLYKTNNVINKNNLSLKFKNGFMLQYGTIKPDDYDFSPYFLDVNYNPEAYDENVDYFLNWFANYDCEVRLLLEEILGQILMTDSFPQKSFFFQATSGKNGKSTFFEMISNFAGDLSESLALEEMVKAENIAILNDKIVNCGDDIDDKIINSSRIFKNLVAGNSIMSRELYGRAKKMKNRATLLFSCNEMPKFKDKSGGIDRRIVVIPCLNVITKPDLSLDSKLSTDNAKSYILNLGLKGLKRILERGGNIIEPKLIIDTTNEYLTNNNSIKLFLESKLENNENIIDKDCANVYFEYKVFCEDEGLGIYSRYKFTSKLKSLGYDVIPKTINGITKRVIIKK